MVTLVHGKILSDAYNVKMEGDLNAYNLYKYIVLCVGESKQVA